MKSLTPPQNTFVLRFWWSIVWDADTSDAKRSWRGRVEHLQSGESLYFRNMEDLIEFIERFMSLPEEGA